MIWTDTCFTCHTSSYLFLQKWTLQSWNTPFLSTQLSTKKSFSSTWGSNNSVQESNTGHRMFFKLYRLKFRKPWVSWSLKKGKSKTDTRFSKINFPQRRDNSLNGLILRPNKNGTKWKSFVSDCRNFSNKRNLCKKVKSSRKWEKVSKWETFNPKERNRKMMLKLNTHLISDISIFIQYESIIFPDILKIGIS